MGMHVQRKRPTRHNLRRRLLQAPNVLQMKATHIVELRRSDRPGMSSSILVYHHKGYWMQDMPAGMRGGRYDPESGMHVPVGNAPATGEYLVLPTMTELPDGWHVGDAQPAAFTAKRV